jgi:hypothetical protein
VARTRPPSQRTGSPAHIARVAKLGGHAWEAPPPSSAGGTASLESYFEPPFRHIHGYPKQASPLSCRGPMCSGGLLSLVSKRVQADDWMALLAAKLGRQGVIRPPFAPLAPTEDALSNTDAGADCPHATCRAGSFCDFFHISLECPHPLLANIRPRITQFACRVAQLVLTDEDGLNHIEVLSFDSTPGAWSSRAGRFILHRLLTCTTWSHRDIARGHAAERHLGLPTAGLWLTLPHLLASRFDTWVCKTHLLRPLANSWVSLAGSLCHHIAQAWRTSLLPYPLRARAPTPPL